jgi:hypothetical protein
LIVRVARSPGKTIPTAGETDNQGAPAVAVNEMGESFVDKVTVCATEGLGGAVKKMLFGFTLKVEGGEVTLSVTVTTAGDPTPATVMLTEEL